jgi:hypothetical protein
MMIGFFLLPDEPGRRTVRRHLVFRYSSELTNNGTNVKL